MKKLLPLAMCLALLFSFGAQAAELAQPGTFPVVSEPVTINVMVYLETGGNYDWNTNYTTEYMEATTGVRVNWITAPIENFLEKLNLAMASGDQIDFVACGGNSNTAVTTTLLCKYADQGLIIPIEDLIDNNTVYMKECLNGVEGFREALTTPDGHIYAVPWFSEAYHEMYYGKMWINMNFLENLGMEVPTTTEEFEEMLIRFRDEDANGNGDPSDEIPMIGAIDNFGCKIDTFLMSAFIYDDGENRLYIDETGEVISVFTQEKFREGLEWLAHLYDEGLIYPDSFTQTRAERNTVNSQKYESVCGAMPNIHHGIGNRASGEPQRWVEYEPISPVIGPDGLRVTRVTYFARFGLDQTAGFIPSTCKQPELVIQWLDQLYTKEGQDAQIWGAYGISWTEADEGTLGVDGSPATYKTLDIPEDSPYYGNDRWFQRFPMFQTAERRNGMQQPADMKADDGSGLESFLYHYSEVKYAPYGVAIENVVPPLYYSEADASTLARLQTNINTYVEESIARFITGQLDLEGDWESYLNELEAMGLEEYLEMIQTYYNASAFAVK